MAEYFEDSFAPAANHQHMIVSSKQKELIMDWSQMLLQPALEQLALPQVTALSVLGAQKQPCPQAYDGVRYGMVMKPAPLYPHRQSPPARATAGPTPEDVPVTKLIGKGMGFGSRSGDRDQSFAPQTQNSEFAFGSYADQRQPPARSGVRKKGRLTRQEVMEKGITTLMMHQIHPSITQKDLIETLDQHGFAGRYDYVYMPVPADQDSNKYAFINMVDSDAAASLVGKWSRSVPFAKKRGNGPAVFFSMAAIQGLAANLTQLAEKTFTGRTVGTSRNSPFVAGGLPLSL